MILGNFTIYIFFPPPQLNNPVILFISTEAAIIWLNRLSECRWDRFVFLWKHHWFYLLSRCKVGRRNLVLCTISTNEQETEEEACKRNTRQFSAYLFSSLLWWWRGSVEPRLIVSSFIYESRGHSYYFLSILDHFPHIAVITPACSSLVDPPVILKGRKSCSVRQEVNAEGLH